jgi:SAM-dependent methyltransferase
VPDRALAYIYFDGSGALSEAEALGAIQTASAKKGWEAVGVVHDHDGAALDLAVERMSRGEADVLAVLPRLPDGRHGSPLFDRAEREGWRFALLGRGIEQGVAPWDEFRAVEEAARAAEPLTDVPLPPARLRLRVSGHSDAGLFEGMPAVFLRDAAAALRLHGHELGESRSVLDFGCGPGRLLRRLSAQLPDARLVGIDVDAEAVAWVASALPEVRALTVPSLPPTALQAAEFDLVIAFSVFTHLDEDRQDAWLEELARVAAPGGTLLLTVNGDFSIRWHREHPLFNLSPEVETQLESRGMAFSRDDGWGREFPDWYHTTFHTPAYISSHWARWFEVLDVIPSGAQVLQDLVVLRPR